MDSETTTTSQTQTTTTTTQTSEQHIYHRVESGGDVRTCWVCFNNEEDEPTLRWVQPCRCKGTTKWVHVFCLQRWFDEKQHGNPTVQVFCPQCNTEYKIKYPTLSHFHLIIDGVNKFIDKLSPIMTGALVIGCFYWSAVTIGGLTVWQVMGVSFKEGRNLFEKQDTFVLLIGLPTIPCALILARMIHWEEYLLRVWRQQSRRWWILRKIVGDHTPHSDTGIGADPNDQHATAVRVPLEIDAQLDFVSTTRLICGALLLPTFAAACGRLFFSDVTGSPLKRTVMGGMVFVGVKGVLHMYHRQQQYVRLAQREIEDFHEEPASSSL